MKWWISSRLAALVPIDVEAKRLPPLMSVFKRAEAESIDRATKRYPDSVREGSALWQSMTDMIAALEKTNPAFFGNSRWPEVLAERAAAAMGIQPAADLAKPIEGKARTP